jgi:hypothetical protein
VNPDETFCVICGEPCQGGAQQCQSSPGKRCVDTDACARALVDNDPLAREIFVEAPAREMLGDLSNWKPTGLRP